ncbi:MAG: hypothetical protein EP341_08835 [Sphingomonadales bacterium]|nr:MAG: hypothetical protein EP341_08835 [Sphingomonadales bacterium]
MSGSDKVMHAYVIKAEDILAANYLDDDAPRPVRVEWINRGTDQVLRPTTSNMLLRTLFQPVDTPSIQRLHDSSGLRVVLESESDREAFAHAFAQAQKREAETKEHVVTAIFENRDAAEQAVARLHEAGLPVEAISLLFKASAFSDPELFQTEGHSTLSIAGAMAGSGVAGALFGLAVLAVPGVGPVAAAGALAGTAITSVASFGGIVGATGGAIAKMLTDHDVDGVTAALYDQQIKRGKVFVSVDTSHAGADAELARSVLDANGGKSIKGG